MPGAAPERRNAYAASSGRLPAGGYYRPGRRQRARSTHRQKPDRGKPDGISDYASKYGSSGTDSLTDVYNSNDETKYKSIIKKFVDIAKGSDDVTVDQYSASSNTKDSINNLGKLSLFASNMSNYSDDGCASVLQSLFYS